MEWLAIVMFLAAVLVLLAGFPVALTLGGIAIIFALGGALVGVFDPVFLNAMPSRIYGTMRNETLLAVPLFIFMGVMLERARIAESLLESLTALFGSLRGGLGFAVTLVGVLLAASTGIVGATVVTMGLLSLPTMLKRGYDPQVATGTICAAGTLGQIIPPSIVLVLLGDVLSSAYSQAQLSQGIFNTDSVSVGDLFAGALLPGLLLVVLYLAWLAAIAFFRPESVPPLSAAERRQVRLAALLQALLPPLILIVAVLGSILVGFATPTEAAGVGAVGALVLALTRQELTSKRLYEVMRSTTRISSMVFLILIGASIFSLVFRGYGGDRLVQQLLTDMPGGELGALLTVMVVMFLLGFVLDFIEITFVVVPIVGPVLLAMGMDPVWLGVLIAVNLQTSFLTPPFGFALFYLRGVAPARLPTGDIYRGVVPFILIQIVVMLTIFWFEGLATWLPERIYG